MLKPDILRKKADFDKLYKKGKSAGEKYVVVFARENGLPYNRTAFLASKKVGDSVRRNRARRLMKESYRSLQNQCVPGMDLIIVARNTITGTKCGQVRESLLRALGKVGALK